MPPPLRRSKSHRVASCGDEGAAPPAGERDCDAKEARERIERDAARPPRRRGEAGHLRDCPRSPEIARDWAARRGGGVSSRMNPGRQTPCTAAPRRMAEGASGNLGQSRAISGNLGQSQLRRAEGASPPATPRASMTGEARRLV